MDSLVTVSGLSSEWRSDVNRSNPPAFRRSPQGSDPRQGAFAKLCKRPFADFSCHGEEFT